MSRKLIVEIVGDTASLERSFGRASTSAQTFGSRMSGLGKAAAFAAGSAGVTALTIAARAGVSEWIQHQKVAAQTAAVLKSTGGAAGITAKHVGDLATQVMNYSGIDDEAIQSTENLVLGFTNIRNAAGKNNDIFDRTVKLVTDYSVRTGKDANQAAVLFGKALNDLAKGKIPATIRGVGSLSEATRKQIKAHLDAGDVTGAQAILLKQLEGRYQGAAAAAGKTLPGQLEILKQKFNNLAGQGVEVIIKELQDLQPIFAAIEKTIRALIPVLGPLAKYLVDNIAAPFKVIADLINGDWSKAWADLKKPVEDAVNAIKTTLGSLKPVWDALVAGVQIAWGEINTIVTTVWNGIKTLTSTVWNGIQTAVMTVLATLQSTVARVVSAIKTTMDTTWNALKTAATTTWSGIKMAITTPIEAAKTAVVATVNAIKSTVGGVFSALSGAVSREWSGIRNAITGAINAAKGVVVGAVSAIKNALNDTFHAFESVGSKLKSLIITPINYVIDKLNSIHIPGFSIHIPGLSVAGVQVFGGADIGWGGLDPFHIPKLAAGGIAMSPMLAMIGEEGPEAVVPLNRGGFGGVTVNVTAGTVVGSGGMAELADTVYREFVRKAGRNPSLGLT